MKLTLIIKNLLILQLVLVFTTGCQDNVIGDFEPISQETDEIGLDKKGAAFSNKKSAWSYKTSDIGAHWMYSWGNTLQEEIPDNVEFVPMFWGKGSVTDENLDRIKQLVAEGKVKYVLGFNEPDGAEQANMTVDEAIALWPRLEEIGVPLISPATVNPTNVWMTEFMDKAVANGLRIDYVGVHHYGGNNVLGFINKLKETYEAYDRPIWITEFAVADWSAATPENNKYSEEEVLAFMQQVLPALDDIDWVHRYSWFDGSNGPLFTSRLFDEDDNITPLGEFYANHNPNAEIGPGTDVIVEEPVTDNNLILNGGFESGTAEPWGGFKNGAVGDATTIPFEGNYCGRIENGDGSLFQIVPVEAGVTYTIKLQSKWNQEVTQSFTAKIRNTADNAVLFDLGPMPTSAEWEETSLEFMVPDGVTELKIVFFKGQGFPPFFMDNVSLEPTL